MQKHCSDLLIIGGGSAGMTAGLYASRAGLKTILLERKMTGGQIVNAEKIENIPGFPDGISGSEFGSLLLDQAVKYGMETQLSEVTKIQQNQSYWNIETFEDTYTAQAVIVASGSTLKRLGVPKEEELHGSGVSYCATCDGAFFRNQVVGVVGGGDSALDEAITLSEFASDVIVFHDQEYLHGQQILQKRVLDNPKISIRSSVSVDSIFGNGKVEGIVISDSMSKAVTRINLDGVFIYVGLDPNTRYLSDILSLDRAGHIPTDIWMRTSLPGILAAGDTRQNSAAQIVSSAGDGATAAIAAYRYIRQGDWGSGVISTSHTK